ncbi:MAG: DUF1295 domain-containing protein [Rhodothermales bacterium]|nr:DUF1295 domain-containing protein [Rhodothermales bacterium]
MNKDAKLSLFSIPAAILVAAGMAWALGSEGVSWRGRPVVWYVVAWVFAVQWISFVPARAARTERFYDLVGSKTFAGAALGSVFLTALVSGPVEARSILVLVMVLVWAARLGSFLTMRIHRTGRDARFDEIKVSTLRFLNAWTLQGLWVVITLAPALVVWTIDRSAPLQAQAGVGVLLWAAGLTMEAVADAQKYRFSQDPSNEGAFIRSGLWAWSRHPNYFGEIVVWVGVLIVAMPVLAGWQWIAVISPVFVWVLLTKISGVPILERRADEKWGGRDDYEAYKRETPELIPKPPFESPADDLELGHPGSAL